MFLAARAFDVQDDVMTYMMHQKHELHCTSLKDRESFSCLQLNTQARGWRMAMMIWMMSDESDDHKDISLLLPSQ
jgi:hypothetical protein